MRGLYDKYIIKKVDGSLTVSGAKYFALRADTDPHARVALKAYADSVRKENPQLADDLDVWLEEESCKEAPEP